MIFEQTISKLPDSNPIELLIQIHYAITIYINYLQIHGQGQINPTLSIVLFSASLFFSLSLSDLWDFCRSKSALCKDLLVLDFISLEEV